MSQKSGNLEAHRSSGPVQNFDSHRFVRVWDVLEGDAGAVGHRLEIRHLGGDRFGLYAVPEGEGVADDPVQELIFNPETATLEDDPDDVAGLHRCISFWDMKRHGHSRNRIFGFRRIRSLEVEPDGEYERYLLPWESVGTDPNNGTWGAEEGGG